jgi:hypothetical protein
MGMDTAQFIGVMKRWREYFDAGADLPVIGATESDLKKINVPTLIIPGNDKTHAHATGELAHRMITGSEIYDLWPGDLDIDLFPAEDWAAREAEQAKVSTEFLSRVLVAA